ncbi:hypothetical protein OQA88_12119 [Cercophora sp. LCS_1]
MSTMRRLADGTYPFRYPNLAKHTYLENRRLPANSPLGAGGLSAARHLFMHAQIGRSTDDESVEEGPDESVADVHDIEVDGSVDMVTKHKLVSNKLRSGKVVLLEGFAAAVERGFQVTRERADKREMVEETDGQMSDDDEEESEEDSGDVADAEGEDNEDGSDKDEDDGEDEEAEDNDDDGEDDNDNDGDDGADKQSTDWESVRASDASTAWSVVGSDSEASII